MNNTSIPGDKLLQTKLIPEENRSGSEERNPGKKRGITLIYYMKYFIFLAATAERWWFESIP